MTSTVRTVPLPEIWVFDDTMSGRVADRPGLQKALDILRKGDTFGVCKLDRLGRSVKQLDDLVRIDVNRGADFRLFSFQRGLRLSGHRPGS